MRKLLKALGLDYSDLLSALMDAVDKTGERVQDFRDPDSQEGSKLSRDEVRKLARFFGSALADAIIHEMESNDAR